MLTPPSVAPRSATWPIWGDPRVRFAVADESLEAPGTPGPFGEPVADLEALDGMEFVRLHFFFYTHSAGPGVCIDEITLPVRAEVEEP